MRDLGACWTTRKMCSSSVVPCLLLLVSNPIAGANSGITASSTPVSRARRSALAGWEPSSSFDSSPIPSAREPAADALGRDEADARGLVDHLPLRLVVGREVELRDEAQAAHEAQRILGERVRRHRPQHAVVEVLLPAERIDEVAAVDAGAPSRSR